MMGTLKFVRLIKGRYWYFRSKETGDVRLPGGLKDPEFYRAYAKLLNERESARAFNKERKRRKEVEAQFFEKRRAAKEPTSEPL
jgi:hypothetical protein